MDEKTEKLLQTFFEKKQVGLAKIITLIENRADDYEEVLSRLFPRSRNAYRVGITGPPGAGKGTQAQLLAEKRGLYHLETSRLLEAAFNSDNLKKVVQVKLKYRRKYNCGNDNSDKKDS